jgi:hypothetical protein
MHEEEGISSYEEAHMSTFDESIPRPPVLHPTWTTWMWISFMLAVIILTTIGLWPNGVY